MIRRLALVVLCLAVFAAGPAQALFSVLGLKNSMVDFLLEQLSTEGEFEITAESVDEPGDGITSIQGLKIADGEGVWLTAEQLYFSWNPTRLLRGEVEFSDLSMSGVEILRAPVVPPGQEREAVEAATPEVDSGAFKWPRSPLTLRIDRIALERVRIDEAVFGHAISFDAEGAARDEGDIQSARLKIDRTDAIAGQIALDYSRRFSDNTLAVDLAASEAPGGLVTALASLPPDAPSEITLRADGPPTDWRLTFELALAETLWADGEAAISYQGPIRVDAEFSARPGAKMSPEIANLLGSEARIIAKVAEGPDGTILIEQGGISSPDLNLTAKGSYSRRTAAADLEVELEAGARLAQPFDGVAFGGLSFVGVVKGAPGSFAADGDMVMDGLATAPVDIRRAELTVDVRQSGPEGMTTTELNIEGLTRGLRLDKLGADVIGDAETQIIATLTGNQLTLDTAWLDSQVLQLSASGAANIETQAAELGFGLGTPQLGKVAGPYGIDASGQIDLSGEIVREGAVTTLTYTAALGAFAHAVADAKALSLTGTVRQDSQGTSFSARGDATALRLDRIDADLLPSAGLDTAGTLRGDTLDLTYLRLSSPLLTASLRGELELTSRSGAMVYQVDTPDLGPVARLYEVPATGSLSASGAAQLPDQGKPPRLTGDLSASALTWDGTAYGAVTLGHDVLISENPEGSLKLTTSGGPYGGAKLETAFSLAQPTLVLTGLRASAMGLDASGELTTNLEGPFAEGALSVSSGDLRGLSRVVGTPLSGAAKARILLTAPGGRQNAGIDVRANALSSSGIRIGAARIRGSLADLLGAPSVNLDVDASTIALGGPTLETATLRAKGPLSRLDISVDAAGQADREPVALSAAASVNAAGASIRAGVSRLEASLGEDRISLNQTLQVNARGATLQLRDLDLALPDGGRLAGGVTRYGGPLAGDLTLSAPKLDYLKRLAGIPLSSGSLEVQTSFDTRRSRARADVTAAGRNLRFEGVDAPGALGVDATLSLRGPRAEIDGTVTGDFDQPLRIVASLPIRLSGGLPGLARRGPVSGSLDWAGEIGEIWALVPAPGSVLTGGAVVDLAISGDIAAPQISGSARVEDGGFQQADLGTILTGLKLSTTISPGGNLGLRLTASDGAKGSVIVQGTFGIDASGVDLKTDIDHAVLIRRDDVTARVDGTIAVQGPVDDLAITGKILIEDAEVRLINNNPPSVVTLGDVLIKGQPEPTQDSRQGGIRLAVDVEAPGRVFVRGRGLESEWTVGLKARGTASNPVLTGRIERKRGSLDLIGKTFDLTRGRIDFDGGAEIDPRIDIALERRTADLTGRILVDGYASDPQLRFASTPALPEDEVLPRTLFGKSSQALTGSQAIQLALGIATLMDGGGGTLDQVRGAVGLDSLRVEQDEEGNASVAIGKEVAEGVWVGSKQSLGDGGSSVAVEIEVFDDLLLDAEVEQGGGSSVGVQWKTDF